MTLARKSLKPRRNNIDPLEKFWDAVLSRSPRRIRAAIRPLDDLARAALIAHLSRMTTESGWQPEQQESARAALKVIVPEEDRPASKTPAE